MVILRIENDKGAGPFRNDEVSATSRKVRDLSYEAEMPSPYDSEKEPRLHSVWYRLTGPEQDGHIFGFRSRAQLRLYWPPHITLALRKLGFYVRYYEVEAHRIIFGNAQICYPKVHATRVRA